MVSPILWWIRPPHTNIIVAEVKKMINVKNWPTIDMRSRFKFSRLIPKQLMMHKIKNSKPNTQTIMPTKLNGLYDFDCCWLVVGIWLILRCSNELHRPMKNSIKPNLKTFHITSIKYDRWMDRYVHAIGKHNTEREIFQKTVYLIELRFQTSRINNRFRWRMISCSRWWTTPLKWTDDPFHSWSKSIG